MAVDVSVADREVVPVCEVVRLFVLVIVSELVALGEGVRLTVAVPLLDAVLL